MTDRKLKPVRPRLEALVAQPRSAQGAGQGSAGLGCPGLHGVERDTRKVLTRLITPLVPLSLARAVPVPLVRTILICDAGNCDLQFWHRRTVCSPQISLDDPGHL
jgi:hypothetical protein